MKKFLSGLIVGAFVFGLGAIDAQPAHAGYKAFSERMQTEKIDKAKERLDKAKDKLDNTREKFGQKNSDGSNRPEPPKDSNGNPLPPPDRNSNQTEK